jgi:hypothetical protein
LADASDIVTALAPVPVTITGTLSSAMDATQSTIPLKAADAFPAMSTVLIDNELLYYFGKSSPTGGAYYQGAGNLTGAQRGRHATPAATHAQDVTVKDYEYPLRARRAELAIFEWLWESRGYKPARSGPVGSESYSIGPEIETIVKRIMGPRFANRTKSVGIKSTFPRYDPLTRYPRWVGNG